MIALSTDLEALPDQRLARITVTVCEYSDSSACLGRWQSLKPSLPQLCEPGVALRANGCVSMVEHSGRMTRRDPPDAMIAGLNAAGFDEVREIGHGGFGVVYRCWQRAVGRTVAVKVLTSDDDSVGLQRFRREQQAMGRLSGHPNIVDVLEVGTTSGGSPYIVMPYCKDDSLATGIRRNGPLVWSDVLRLGVKIAGALESAHRVDILHRDVKPSNILFTDYGEPQLADFGIAHIVGAFETKTGVVTGSPAFSAPEVLSGESPTPASDVYSLGATLFCALTGHAPFERREGEQVVAQFLRIATEPTPRIHALAIGLDIPHDVGELIEQAMSRMPQDRPATAAAFAEMLRTAEHSHNLPIADMPVPDSADGVSVKGESTQTGSAGKPSERLPTPAKPVSTEMAPAPAFHHSLPVRAHGQRGNLPIELTSFVGRRHELAEAKKTLSAARLVTLTGIGGVGKTRLALRVATDSQRAFADGVWLIELDEVSDPQLVAGVVMATLGLRNHSAGSPLVLLTNYLFDRELLLVLDNCEHLLDSVATLADAVLRTCPTTRILATSREPLGVSGESIMRVPPMSIPSPDRTSTVQGLPSYESVTLFMQRATAALPTFELTEDNQAAVAQICAQLDGLPLPIELAATRLRAMSVQQILDRLTDRYRLLTGGSRAAPSRQQTLRWSIDWSYELCTLQEQRTWERLTVFAHSFELDAAEAICDDDDLLDVVASLVDKSVLIREEADGVVRYRLLDILREYGREKLEATGEYPTLSRRYRDWYERLVLRAEGDAISPRQLDWFDRLDREQPNLRAALQYCLSAPAEFDAGRRIAEALYPFWFCRGYLNEGRLWLDRVLAVHSDADPQRVRSLYMASVFAGLQGDLAEGARLLALADSLTAEHDRYATRDLKEFASGCLALYHDDPVSAVAHFRNAIESAREGHGLFWKVASLLGLGLAHMLLDEAPHSLTCHERLLALTENHGEHVYRGRTYMLGGWARWRVGDPTQARTDLEDGIQFSLGANDPVNVGRCLQTLAWIEADQHHPERAAVLLGAAAGIWQGIGGPMASYLDHLKDHQECKKQTFRALGDKPFRKQFQRGVQMTVDESVRYAFHRQPPPAPQESVLTPREQQVAGLVAEGLTNKKIAAKLVISQRTAQGHVEHILTKLGFTSRTQIAAWVVEHAHEHSSNP